MPNGMDYSLKNRVIDGTGMILDTEPGTPDDVGTYVTESQLADWIKGKILFTGYYHNGNFYSDSGHTTLLAKVNGALYIDQTNANKALYVCLSSTYQSLTEEAQVQAIIDGLNDGTIVPLKAKQDQNGNVIDQTYETKADASDLKDAIQGNTARIENLEQEHGSYVPVQYRGTNDVPTGKAKYALVESIVGKSRAWNQLVDKTYASTSTVNGITFTNNNDGSWTITSVGTTTDSYKEIMLTNFVNGHKYLLVGCPAGGSEIENTGYSLYVGGLLNTNDGGNGRIFTSNTTSNLRVYIRFYEGLAAGVTLTFRPVLRDITIIFPEGVPSTVAECVAKCPDILKYDAYGTSIVDTTVEGVKSVGVNIYDQEWEIGTINDTTGALEPSSQQIRNKNKIPIVGGQTYYILMPNGTGRTFFYDSNDNLLSVLGLNQSVLAPIGSTYMMFRSGVGYGTTYKDDTQICLDSYSDKTNFHEYMTNTLSLPSSVTLRSAGSVADTDELNVEVLVDGVKVNKRRQTTRVGHKNLGECAWTWNSGYSVWQTQSLNGLAKPISSSQVIPDVTCNGYKPEMLDKVNDRIGDKIISGVSSAGNMRLYDSAFDENSNLNTLLDGVIYNYEKIDESVTLLDPIENNTIATEGGGTINTIQTQTTKIDNCLDVGYLAL